MACLTLERHFELTINGTIKAWYCKVNYCNPNFEVFGGIEYGDIVYVLESLRGPMFCGWRFASFTGNVHIGYDYKIDTTVQKEVMLINCFIKRLIEINPNVAKSLKDGTFTYEAKQLISSEKPYEGQKADEEVKDDIQ